MGDNVIVESVILNHSNKPLSLKIQQLNNKMKNKNIAIGSKSWQEKKRWKGKIKHLRYKTIITQEKFNRIIIIIVSSLLSFHENKF